jgi:hypothetical protein
VDLFGFSELIISSMDLLRLRATKIAESRNDEKVRRELLTTYMNTIDPFVTPHKNFYKAPSLARWGNPTVGTFDYPPGKRRTRESVKK